MRSLVHTPGNAHLLTYTNSVGISLFISVDQIVGYQELNTNHIVVMTVTGTHTLLFDSPEATIAAGDLIRNELASDNFSSTYNDMFLEGEIFNCNPINTQLAADETLDLFITVPADLSMYLHLGLTHGGDVTTYMYKDTTVSDGGTDCVDVTRNFNYEPDALVSIGLGPTITDLGTLKDQIAHIGKSDKPIEASKGVAPTYILPTGTYLLRIANQSGYWITVQQKIQWWEEEVV